MTIDTENLLNSILGSLDRIENIKPDDIPNIDLYMDQVTTFMDSRLRGSARNPGDDKILTKTMINNYAKNNLIPSPIKKKYSKEHILLLIFIYYYKSILSITDIQTLLTPITENFFSKDKNFDLEDIYREVFSMEKEMVEDMKQDVIQKFKRAEDTFSDAPEKNQEFLKKFSFICLLSFDVYVKKLLIEKMIDEIHATDVRTREKSSKEKNKEDKSPKSEKVKKEKTS